MNRIVVPIALAVALFTGFYLGRYQVTTVHAQQSRSVPKAWGTFKGSIGSYMIFEDSAGTLRMFEITSPNQINRN